MTRRSPVNPGERAPEGMAGLAKGLAVLEAFDGRQALTIAEAAQATGATRAAARRCLLTLAALGYLSDDGKFFRPTPRTLRLGAIYLEATPLPRLAQPYLAQARDVLQESVSLAVLEDGWAIFVARAEAERIVSTGVRVGARLPAWASATGRVLLAALPAAELDAYLARVQPERRTRRTAVDVGVIRARIEAAGREGLAFSDEELEIGMRAMAVPVVDSHGRIQAALSVSAFAARASLEDMRGRFAEVLRRTAMEIGRRL